MSHSYLVSHNNEQLSIFPKMGFLMRKVITHNKISANTENDHISSLSNPISNLLPKICLTILLMSNKKKAELSDQKYGQNHDII